MTPGWEVAAEIGKAIYSLGLLALGVVALVAAPPAVRVLRDLTAALRATAGALRTLTAGQETIERVEAATGRIEADIAEIKARLRRPE